MHITIHPIFEILILKIPTLPTPARNKLIMKEKSGVGSGVGGVGNQRDNSSVAMQKYGRRNVPPIGTGCPNAWDNQSQRVGQ